MVVMCSEIFVCAKPVYLRGSVAVDDVAFVVLEIPRDNNENVAFADPDPFLNLSLNPAKTGDTVRAPDFDMV